MRISIALAVLVLLFGCSSEEPTLQFKEPKVMPETAVKTTAHHAEDIASKKGIQLERKSVSEDFNTLLDRY